MSCLAIRLPSLTVLWLLCHVSVSSALGLGRLVGACSQDQLYWRLALRSLLVSLHWLRLYPDLLLPHLLRCAPVCQSDLTACVPLRVCSSVRRVTHEFRGCSMTDEEMEQVSCSYTEQCATITCVLSSTAPTGRPSRRRCPTSLSPGSFEMTMRVRSQAVMLLDVRYPMMLCAILTEKRLRAVAGYFFRSACQSAVIM